MFWLITAILEAIVCYLLVVASDDRQNQAQEDAEQMEFLRCQRKRRLN